VFFRLGGKGGAEATQIPNVVLIGSSFFGGGNGKDGAAGQRPALEGRAHSPQKERGGRKKSRNPFPGKHGPRMSRGPRRREKRDTENLKHSRRHIPRPAQGSQQKLSEQTQLRGKGGWGTTPKEKKQFFIIPRAATKGKGNKEAGPTLSSFSDGKKEKKKGDGAKNLIRCGKGFQLARNMTLLKKKKGGGTQVETST